MLGLILTNVGLIPINALVLIFKTSGKAYFEEKGKNLATKQDIKDITRVG